jgi:LPXTG-motif cell wall-anchored protein
LERLPENNLKIGVVLLRLRPVACSLAALALSCGSVVALAGPSSAATAASTAAGPLSGNMSFAVGPAQTTAAVQSGCQLANGVKHVFYLGFDNFHLRRDNSNDVADNGDDNLNNDLNIPSDLEQVPNLYNFLRGTSNAGTTPNASTTDNANYADGRNTTYSDGTPYPGGTILTNHHTPLISHTSVDFTTSYSGVYGDRHGVAVSQNSIAAYTGNASAPVASASGFSYWTDPLGISGDPTTTITTKDANGNAVNAPAPWVPFTRAGCDVGAVSATGFTLESANSAKDVSTSNVTFTSADEGLAVHCAQTSSICDLANTDTDIKAVPDLLPNEPGGYTGFNALYGNRFIAPAINDRINGTTSGGSTTVNLLRSTTSAFPGFNAEDGNYTLGYTLAMQQAGIPVTFGYLSDAHDCHSSLVADYGNTGASGNARCDFTNVPGSTAAAGYNAFGSGEQGYTNYLSQLNTDFGTFFQDAKNDGYTTANTEFVFYSDENDHAAEATPANGTATTAANGTVTPACDGVTVACQYNHAAAQTTPTPGQLGEVTVKLDTALPQSTQPYFVLNDSAPDFYLSNSGSAAPPGQSDANVRAFERSLGSQMVNDPYTGSSVKLVNYMADQTELNALHMITADPLRSPTVTAFAPGQDYVESGSPNDCGATAQQTCSDNAFAYIHGDFAPETNTTWAAFAGPGVANLGTSNVWTDQVDLRPTLLALTGLTDDYTDDGRVITQILTPGTVPATLTTQTATDLGTLLKKLNAPVYMSSEGANDGFGPATLVADTEALESNATNDSTYTDVEGRISTITAQRNSVTTDIKARLLAAESGTPIDPTAAASDEATGQCLLNYANALKTYALNPTAASAPTDCATTTAPPTALPETSHTALFVLVGGAVMAGGLLLFGRRRNRMAVA